MDAQFIHTSLERPPAWKAHMCIFTKYYLVLDIGVCALFKSDLVLNYQNKILIVNFVNYKTPLAKIGSLLSIGEKGSYKSTHPAWGGQRYVFVSILSPVKEGQIYIC